MQHLMSRLMLGCAVYALLAPPAIAAANKPLAEKESAGANASASNVYAIDAQSAQSSQPVSQSEQRVVEDIIVTATRNETRLQETPLAITAISGSSLRERQITDVASLAQNVPSMQIGRSVANVRIAIRGVGLDSTAAGAEGRVAYHVDGVYISRPSAIAGTYFDLERIEVLRGPQGTLYGRNATGGVVNVITAKPKFEFGGYAKIGVGNYDTIRAEGAVNLPISDVVSLRLAAQSIDQNKGFGRNTLLDEDIADQHAHNFRAQLLVNPTDALEVLVSANYSKVDDHSSQDVFAGRANSALVPLGVRLGGSFATNPRDVNGNFPALNRREAWGASLHITWDLGGAELTSLTGYHDTSQFIQKDQDLTEIAAAPFRSRENAHQWSQELRLSGNFDRLKWQAGVFGFWEKVDGVLTISPLLSGTSPATATLINGALNAGTLKTDALAAFGQVDFAVTDTLSLIAGGRYSWEKKTVDEFNQGSATTLPFNPNVPIPTVGATGSQSWSDFTPMVSIQFKPGQNKLVYATYSQGFKSGGYSVGSRLPVFKPETLTNYEVGLKADWLDGDLRTNLAFFYYDYKNLQLQQSSPTAAGIITTFNAKGATIKGAEAEIIIAPVRGFRVDLTGSAIDSEYNTLFIDNPRTSAVDPVDLKGRSLTQAPSYTLNAAAQYTANTSAGDFTLRGEFITVGRSYFSPYNFRDILSQPAYSKVNAFLNYQSTSGKWRASLWARNLTNKLTQASSGASGSLFGSPVLAILDPPRTFGLDLGLSF